MNSRQVSAHAAVNTPQFNLSALISTPWCTSSSSANVRGYFIKASAIMKNLVQAVGKEAQHSPDSAVDVEPLLLDTQLAVSVATLLGYQDWERLDAKFPHIIEDIAYLLEDANENIKNPIRQAFLESPIAPWVSKVGRRTVRLLDVRAFLASFPALTESGLKSHSLKLTKIA